VDADLFDLAVAQAQVLSHHRGDISCLDLETMLASQYFLDLSDRVNEGVLVDLLLDVLSYFAPCLGSGSPPAQEFSQQFGVLPDLARQLRNPARSLGELPGDVDQPVLPDEDPVGDLYNLFEGQMLRLRLFP